MFYSSQEFINHYSEIYYLYSIIFEHKGDTEKAYKICADSLSFIEKEIYRELNLIPYQGRYIY